MVLFEDDFFNKGTTLTSDNSGIYSKNLKAVYNITYYKNILFFSQISIFRIMLVYIFIKKKYLHAIPKTFLNNNTLKPMLFLLILTTFSS